MDAKNKIENANLDCISGGVVTGTDGGKSFKMYMGADGKYVREMDGKTNTYTRDEILNQLGGSGMSCAQIDNVFAQIESSDVLEIGEIQS